MSQALKSKMMSPLKLLPRWFRQDLPDMEKIREMKDLLRKLSLHSVCESAHCPNQGACWNKGVATFLILGNICTRRCQFCAVKSGIPVGVDKQEPKKVAKAVKILGLAYVVITSVTRDDLNDQGAGLFASTIEAIKKEAPETKVEVLIPDLSGRKDLLRIVVNASPNVIGHNIETVKRLFPKVRSHADYSRSVDVLRMAKDLDPKIITKSGFMVGFGENKHEVCSLLDDLVNAGCDVVTIGQYLSPGIKDRNIDVERYVSPEEFRDLKHYGEAQGLKYILSEPLARSSFLAEEGYSRVVGLNAIMQKH